MSGNQALKSAGLFFLAGLFIAGCSGSFTPPSGPPGPANTPSPVIFSPTVSTPAATPTSIATLPIYTPTDTWTNTPTPIPPINTPTPLVTSVPTLGAQVCTVTPVFSGVETEPNNNRLTTPSYADNGPWNSILTGQSVTGDLDSAADAVDAYDWYLTQSPGVSYRVILDCYDTSPGVAIGFSLHHRGGTFRGGSSCGGAGVQCLEPSLLFYDSEIIIEVICSSGASHYRLSIVPVSVTPTIVVPAPTWTDTPMSAMPTHTPTAVSAVPTNIPTVTVTPTITGCAKAGFSSGSLPVNPASAGSTQVGLNFSLASIVGPCGPGNNSHYLTYVNFTVAISGNLDAQILGVELWSGNSLVGTTAFNINGFSFSGSPLGPEGAYNLKYRFSASASGTIQTTIPMSGAGGYGNAGFFPVNLPIVNGPLAVQ